MDRNSDTEVQELLPAEIHETLSANLDRIGETLNQRATTLDRIGSALDSLSEKLAKTFGPLETAAEQLS